MKRFLSKLSTALVLATLALGCGSHNTATQSKVEVPKPDSVADKTPAPKKPAPKKEAGVQETANWKVTLPTDWQLLKPPADSNGLKTELLARSPEPVGKMPIGFTIVSVDAPGDEDAFVMGILEAYQDAQDIKILKGKRVDVSGHPGALVLVLRKLPDGEIVGAVELITSNKVRGYALSCGGDPKHGPEFGPLCAKALETFELK